MSRSKVAVVTGATSGIGAAISRALASSRVSVLLVGRNPHKLARSARHIPRRYLAGTELADLGSLSDVTRLVKSLVQRFHRIDLLVHSAAEYSGTETGSTDTVGLDRLLAVNVRAPFVLTQGVIPLLARARGQVILLNASGVKGAGEGTASYKASKHALQGLADSVRQDLNKKSIRVLSLYPGRVATPGMRRIYARQKQTYAPDLLLRAADVGALVVALSQLPARMEVTDLHLRSVTPY